MGPHAQLDLAVRRSCFLCRRRCSRLCGGASGAGAHWAVSSAMTVSATAKSKVFFLFMILSFPVFWIERLWVGQSCIRRTNKRLAGQKTGARGDGVACEPIGDRISGPV